MSTQYNLRNIRTLLVDGFSESELRNFCFDESDFEDVYSQLSQDIGRDRIVQLLLDHARRKSLIENLLTWAKKLNPAAYEKYQPYQDAISPTTSSSTPGILIEAQSQVTGEASLRQIPSHRSARPTHVFISYARQDGHKYADPLERDLNAAGFATWRDTRNIYQGRDFGFEIEAAIKEALCVVACMTPSVGQGSDNWVRREIRYAMQIAGKPVIPLLFPGGQPTVDVINISYIDFSQPNGELCYDEGLHNLLTTLNTLNQSSFSYPYHQNDDFYRQYLQKQFEVIESRLKQLVFSYISLQSEASFGEVAPPMPDPSLSHLELYIQQTILKFEQSVNSRQPTVFDSFEAAFEYYEKRLLLLGDPGTGKTISLLTFARESILHRLADSSLPLPLYAPLGTWNPQWQGDRNRLPELADWLAKDLPGKRNEITRLIAEGRVLLLLDGLDELGGERLVSHRRSGFASFQDRGATENLIVIDLQSGINVGETTPAGSETEIGSGKAQDIQIEAEIRIVRTYDPRELFIDCFVQQIPQCTPAIVSCRIKDYHQLQTKLDLKGAVHLQKLTDKQIQQYLQNLPGLWEALKANPDLLDVARVPLLLNLFTIAYRDMDEAIQLRDLSQGELRDRIFSQYVKRRYEREEKKLALQNKHLSFTVEELKAKLEQLALNNFDSSEEGSLSNEDLEKVVDEGQKAAFIELATLLHILLPASDTGKKYRFIHLLMRDFFAFPAACACLTDPNTDVRHKAALALVRLSATDPRTLEPLLKAHYACYEESGVRQRIVEALGRFEGAQIIEALTNALLCDESSDVRWEAITALERFTGTDVADTLIQALSYDRFWRVRAEAAEVLGAFDGSQIIEPLVQALEDSDDDVRANAARSLGRIGDLQTVHLLAMLLGDPYEKVRQAASEALQNFGITALGPVLDALRSESVAARAYAARTLGEMGLAEAVEPSLVTLHDTESEVRTSAIASLGQLGDSRVIDPLLSLLADEDEEVCKSAAAALASFGQCTLESLLSALQSDDRLVRKWAVFALGLMKDEQTVKPLIAILEDPDEEVRMAGIQALGAIGDMDAVEPLLRRLADTSLTVQIAAVEVLGDLRPPEAVEPLIALLDHADADLCVAVANALGQLQDNRAIVPLIGLLGDIRTDSDDDSVCEQVVGALAEFGEAVIKPLVAAQDSDSIEQRRLVVRVLRSIHSQRVVSHLVQMLDDPVSEVRLEAIEALGEQPSVYIISPLARLLQKKNEESDLRCAAVRTLAATDDQRAVPSLFIALGDVEDEPVCLAAIEAIIELELLDDEHADRPLEVMRTSPRVRLRLEALKALAKRAEQYDIDDQSLIKLTDKMIHTLRDPEIVTLPQDDMERGRLFDTLEEMLDTTLEDRGSMDHFREEMDLFFQAMHLFLDEDCEAAQAKLGKAIEWQPDRWYHYYWRAEISSAWLGKYHERSLEDLNAAISLRPEVSYIYDERGQVQHRLGNYEAALHDLKRALTLQTYHNTYYWIGVTHYEMKNYTEALEALKKSIVTQDNANSHHSMGWTYYEMGRYEEAFQAFSEAINCRIQLYKNDYSGRGWSQYELGQYTAAFEDFTTAENNNGRGRVFAEVSHDYISALAEYDKAIEQAPGDHSDYQWRGLVQLILGNLTAAIADITRAIELQPDNSINYYWRALTHIAAGDWKMAVQDFDTDKSMISNDDYLDIAYSTFWRGIICVKQGQFDQAQSLFGNALTTALAITETGGNRWRVLGLITLMAGEASTARKHYKSALQIKPLRHQWFSTPLYLHLLTHLFPDRSDIRETWDWLEEQLGPLPTFNREEENSKV